MKTRQLSGGQIIKLLQNAQEGNKFVDNLCRDLGCRTASFIGPDR